MSNYGISHHSLLSCVESHGVCMMARCVRSQWHLRSWPLSPPVRLLRSNTLLNRFATCISLDSACLVSIQPMARFHWAVRFITVRYGTQLCPFPLSEVLNGTKIANRTVPLFWYPSIGVPSTAKLTSERWLVD